MEIKLKKITMKNAKGVKEFIFTPDGKNVKVSGDNGSGKTSIADAYQWCMFDMDTWGRKGAEAIKTTNKEGGYVHFLDHEILVSLEVDGKAKTFRKLLNEKWTTPRGKSEQKYDGNITSYWINDVPKQAKEYQEEINSMIPDNLFKILTDPLYFSEQLPWRERLLMLVQICGGVTNEEVAGDNEDLLGLLETMGELTMENFKAMISGQIKNLDREIDSIPPKIDELTRGIRESEEWSSIENTIDWQKKTIMHFEHELLKASEANKPIIEAQRAIITLEADREALMKQLAIDSNSKRNEAETVRTNLVSEIRNAEQKISGLKNSNSQAEGLVVEYEREKSKLRERFTVVKSEYTAAVQSEFISPELGSIICGKCGQSLPEDNVRDRISKARDAFDQQKAAHILSLDSEKTRINEQGRKLNGFISDLQEQMAGREKEIKALEDLLADKKVQLERISEEISSSPMSMPQEFKNHPKVEEINTKITAARIKTTQNVEDQAQEIYQKKSEATKELERLNSVLFAKQTAEKTKERICELQADLKRISGQKIQLEGQLHLCDLFVVERTKAIEGKINSMFSYVGFKLFREQVNGGIDETCEAIVGETTFSKANTAAEVNAGLDIINTISRFHGISAPVFIDRGESNLHLYPITASQYILLQVEPHPIEVEFI